MKILWFTNTPCSAIEKLKGITVSGGWLVGLERELTKDKDIELSICYYSDTDILPFQFKETFYYPVYRKNTGSKFGRYINRIFNRTFDDKNEIPLLLAIIEKVQPDIIHIHGTEENFGLIQKDVKIPVVISIQGILSSISEKYFAGIPFHIARKYEGLLAKLAYKSVSDLKKEINLRAERERKILKDSEYIIGRTSFDYRITRLLAPKSIYFEGNEILRPIFYAKNWQKEKFSAPIKIVTILGGAYYKGLETIVKSAQILVKNKSFKFNWEIAGIFESSATAKVIKKWLKIDYHELNITLKGNQNEEQLANSLLNSDIYCQSSRIENSPNGLCEAMLVGIPIVASIAGGTGSLIDNNMEGIVIQDGDPYSLAGAILELTLNFDIAVKYANNAKKRAVERHDGAKIIFNLVSIYNQISTNIEK